MTPTEIRKLRKRLSLTQEAFADAVSVSFATVNRWENGKTAPQSGNIERMQELAADNGRAREIATFADLVDHWTGRLTLAIGAGNFRGEVSMMLQAVMKDAYERGARKDALIG